MRWTVKRGEVACKAVYGCLIEAGEPVAEFAFVNTTLVRCAIHAKAMGYEVNWQEVELERDRIEFDIKREVLRVRQYDEQSARLRAEREADDRMTRVAPARDMFKLFDPKAAAANEGRD